MRFSCTISVAENPNEMNQKSGLNRDSCQAHSPPLLNSLKCLRTPQESRGATRQCLVVIKEMFGKRDGEGYRKRHSPVRSFPRLDLPDVELIYIFVETAGKYPVSDVFNFESLVKKH